MHRCTEQSFLAFTFGKWSNDTISYASLNIFLDGTSKNTHIHVEVGSGTSKLIKSTQSQQVPQGL